MENNSLYDVEQDILKTFNFIEKYLDDKTILTAELKLKVWGNSATTVTKQFKMIPDTIKKELKDQQ